MDILKQEYDLPEQKIESVNVKTAKPIGDENDTPFTKIVVAAKMSGIEINNPNHNCKHCYGRGFLSVRLDGTPVPCRCIFKDNKQGLNFHITKNRKDRRKQEKENRKNR